MSSYIVTCSIGPTLYPRQPEERVRILQSRVLEMLSSVDLLELPTK